MTKGETDHIEGAAELDNQHHDTTERIDARVRNTVTTKTFWAGILALAFTVSASWGGVYVYFFGPGFLGLVPERKGVLSYQELLLENQQLKNQIEWQTKNGAAR